MELPAIRAQIKLNIQAATGLIATVHDRRRLSSNITRNEELYKNDGKIHAWDIQRNQFVKDEHIASGAMTDTRSQFILRGYYGINDAEESETAFGDTIVEAVCSAFEKDPTLQGTALMVAMPITGIITEEVFCGILCHKAEITITVVHRHLY